jgi:hypothetical protein
VDNSLAVKVNVFHREVTISFPTRAILMFGSRILAALAYFSRKVPETKGRSLQELEQELTGRAVG